MKVYHNKNTLNNNENCCLSLIQGHVQKLIKRGFFFKENLSLSTDFFPAKSYI